MNGPGAVTLVGLLSGADAAGVHDWHSPRSVDEIRRTVELAGWRFGHVDSVLAGDKATFLRAVGETLRFPDHYGQNLDALADCLDDLTRTDVPTLLLWDAPQVLDAQDPVATRALRGIFTEAAEAGNLPGRARFSVLQRRDA